MINLALAPSSGYVNRTIVEDKMRRFKGECAHFIFNNGHIYIIFTTVQASNLARTHTKRSSVRTYCNKNEHIKGEHKHYVSLLQNTCYLGLQASHDTIYWGQKLRWLEGRGRGITRSRTRRAGTLCCSHRPRHLLKQNIPKHPCIKMFRCTVKRDQSWKDIAHTI